jgi:chaperonin GroES
MDVMPFDDKILVKPDQRGEVRPSGIIVPETAAPKSEKGTVIAVGPGRLLDTGKRVPSQALVGDRILFNRWGGTEVTLEDEYYLVLPPQDLLAILR